MGFPEGIDCLEEDHDCTSNQPFKGKIVERELIFVYLTTKRPFIQKMIYLGIRLRQIFESIERTVIEVYPHALKVRFLRKLPPKNLSRSQDLLPNFFKAKIPSLDSYNKKLNHNHNNALFAAFGVWLHPHGRADSVGTEKEVPIIVPSRKLYLSNI